MLRIREVFLMRIVLIDLQENMPSLGLAYIVSYLNTYLKGHEISIVTQDFMDNFIGVSVKKTKYKQLLNRVKAKFPDLIGIKSVTADYKIATEISSLLKDELKIPIVVGGPHISALPETLVPSFDVGVVGEGEQTFLELVDLLNRYGRFDKERLSEIKGIVYYDENQSISKTVVRDSIIPLDRIPYPARDICDMRRFTSPKQIYNNIRRVTHVITSRGCPYRCVFCSSRVMWPKARFFSAAYVVEEMRSLIKRWNLEAIHIYDDLFIADKMRFRKIVELIENSHDFKDVEFYTMARANLINEEMIKLFKRMNFKGLAFGFESMTENTLKYLKKGVVSVEDNYRAIRLCKEYGIECSGSFILGSPHETREEMMKTINAIKSEKITADIYPLTPLPGTELWAEMEKKGKVSTHMDWEKLSIRNFGENDFIFVNERMGKEEFVKLLSWARDEITPEGNLHLSIRHILNIGVLLKVFSDPFKYLDILKKIVIQRINKIKSRSLAVKNNRL